MFPHYHAMPAARLQWNEKGKPVAIAEKELHG
jgi:hypothetical protein